MHVGFVVPELRRLDEIKSDAMCLCLYQEDWPLRGTPGLVDWRLSGHISRQREVGWISCAPGEVVLMPLSPRLPSEKLLLVGMGSVDDGLGRDRIATGLHAMFEALERIRVHATLLHLPGRPWRTSTEEVVTVLLDVAAEHPEHDEVILVEPVDAHDTMLRVIETRRSARTE
jgi:hypothetical protein